MFIGGFSSSTDAKIRALVFFMLSVALIVVFIIQKGFTTQSYIWMFITVSATAVAAMDNEMMSNAVVGLLGISLGMVLGNTTIQLK
jgi:hypothetical protein